MATSEELRAQGLEFISKFNEYFNQLQALTTRMSEVNSVAADAQEQYNQVYAEARALTDTFNNGVRLEYGQYGDDLNALPKDDPLRAGLINTKNNNLDTLYNLNIQAGKTFREVRLKKQSDINTQTASTTPTETPTTPTDTATGDSGTGGSTTGSTSPGTSSGTATTGGGSGTEPAPDPGLAETVTAKKLRPNPLHAYPTYTYGLSLHLLSVDDYNKIVNGQEYVPTNVLIASAGRYNNQTSGAAAFKRNENFNEDFYFTDLRMTTMIGINEQTRATNALSMNFTLVEPYGLTFLDRLLEASIAIGSENYLQNAYLLQIDFFGNNEEGVPVHPLPNMTKRIPIKILTCNAKVSTRGAEYKIDAQPYSHQAFDESVVNTPLNIEIVAGTVKSFFEATSGAAADEENITFSKDQTYKFKTYADALNSYTNQLVVNKHITIADRYNFKFDGDIGDATIVEPGQLATKAPPMGDTKNSAGQTRTTGDNTADLNLSMRTFPINYGTSIESIITRVIVGSSYIRNQLIVPENEKDPLAYAQKQQASKDSNEPLRWFKIIPTVKLIGFDPKTNRFAREFTYHVVPYTVRNARLPEAPQGKARREDCVKYYHYIYTGLNNDIIDMNIEFNAMYYTAVTAYRKNNMATSGVDGWYNTDPGVETQTPTGKNTIMPQQKVVKLTDQRAMATGGYKTAKDIAAVDSERSLATASRADMLQVDLKIVGDPEFIKQDDLFYYPKIGSDGTITKETTDLTLNNSIRTDNGEIYAYLEFKTPTDINDDNGMMSFDTKYRTSGFSGVYRVLNIENEFNMGKFTQNLTLIRQFNQDDEQKAESLAQRSDGVNTLSQTIVNNAAGGAPAESEANLNRTTPTLPGAGTPSLPFSDAVAGPTVPVNSNNEPATVNPFAVVPAGGSAADQQAGVSGVFGQ